MAQIPSEPEPAPSVVARFEHALDELEQLVQKMEKGEQSLDESLAAYERGVALYRQCQAALEQAELRVRLLSDPQRPDSGVDFLAGEAGEDLPRKRTPGDAG
jgi:exodeoxyribonuclease VII small subunit